MGEETRRANARAIEMTAEHWDSDPRVFMSIARDATSFDHSHRISSMLARRTYDRHRARLRGNPFENLAHEWAKSVGVFGLPAVSALYWDPRAHPHVLIDPVVSTIVLGRLATAAKVAKAKTGLDVLAWLHGVPLAGRGDPLGTIGDFGAPGAGKKKASDIGRALGLSGRFPPADCPPKNWQLRGSRRKMKATTGYKKGSSPGDGKCWSEEQGWRVSQDTKHPVGTIWRMRGETRELMFPTADPNTFTDEEGVKWSCWEKDGDDDHPTLDPKSSPLTSFPKFPVPYLQDGRRKALAYKDKSEIPRLQGVVVPTYRAIAVGWVRNAVAAAKTPKQLAWANRLDAELKSQTKTSCASVPFSNRCVKYLIHYWLIANASAYLCGYWSSKCNPPLIPSGKTLLAQWLEEAEAFHAKTTAPALKVAMVSGAVLLGGLVIINVAQATRRRRR